MSEVLLSLCCCGDAHQVRVERGETGKKNSPSVLSGLSGGGNKVSPAHGQTSTGDDSELEHTASG